MRFARTASIIGLLAAVLFGAVGPIGAADFTREFLRETGNRRYGRVMVEYLTALDESNRLPAELKETFDLEMSKALRVAATNDAFNKEEREKWQAESRERLEKFLKEHQDHPEVASAQSTFGELAMERGLAQIRQSRGTQDKALKARHLTEARKAFEDARPRFVDAVARFEKRFQEMQSALEAMQAVKATSVNKLNKAQSMTEDALFDWLDNRFKVGLTEFYIAETFEDPKDQARVDALAKAAKQFDDIYQDNRESLVGLTAHAWHGKAVDEAGDLELAADIYEEVLANVDANLKIETGLEGIFAQVFYFRALLEIKKGNTAEFAKTAPEWLKTFAPWRKMDGYQGINLEYVKVLIANAEKAPEEEQGKLRAVALKILKDMKLVPSEHQDEAILTLRRLGKDVGENNPTEATALADEAAKGGNWDEAEAKYEQALKLAQDSKKANEKKLVGDIRGALEQVRYRRALARFGEAKYDEVLKTCGEIAKNKESAIGPQAAALAVQAALMLYAQSRSDPDAQAKALDRLTKIAAYLTETWPDQAEADDARIAMGQAQLVQGKFEAAVKVFEEVNPRSQRYGNGLFLAGQTHWRLYTQGGEKADPAKGPQRAAKAESNLQQAVEFFRKKHAERPSDPPPTQLAEGELLLGEVYVEMGNGAKAVELLEPHLTPLIAKKPAEVDNLVLRTFLASVRAYMAAGDPKKAADTALALMEFAPDQPQFNRILVNFMMLMQLEWQKASAAEIEARGGNDLSAKDAVDARLKTTGELLSQLIEKLLARQQIDVKVQLSMARTARDLGRRDLAEPLYKMLLDKADQGDPAVPAKAIPAIRSDLIGIVRAKGDYQAALEQVDKLLEANPNVLEFMMERGRILQAWAEKDESKFQRAVQQWVDIRSKLQSQRVKPPEYFEVNYNAALCLYIDSQKSKDPKKAQDAAKVLNALIFMSPQLNGPKMVAQYNELLKKIDPEGYKMRVEAEKKKAREQKEKANTAAKATAQN